MKTGESKGDRPQPLQTSEPVLADAWLRVIHGDHYDPFFLLGRHENLPPTAPSKAVTVRCLMPDADSVELWLAAGNEWKPLKRIHDGGLFVGDFAAPDVPYHPQLRATFPGGGQMEWVDPYSFMPLLSDMDRHLFGEGKHDRIYEKLGAHLHMEDGVKGTVFRVWAPNARRVSVVGDFNAWDGRRHAMRVLGPSGIWELFIPGLGDGTIYKYEVKTQAGDLTLKADPYGFRAETRPQTATIVCDLEGYEWGDDEWMTRRRDYTPRTRPMSIYEVHLGSWKRPGDPERRFMTYRELADELVPYVSRLGFTHIQLLPVAAHPFDASWGYQVSGYYAPTGRFGHPKDFMAFVDACHQHDLGVIIDWVPAHFPKDEHSLARFDGTPLYEHGDPRQGEHPDWGTLVFNYGRHEVRNFLIANALFWLRYYHIDALRVDAVASMLYLDYSRREGQWVPNERGGRENLAAIEFLREMNAAVYGHHPDCFTVAEESTAWPMVSRPVYLGGLGFGFKWNMGWMHDMLSYMEQDPVYRKFHHGNLTFSLLYAFHENFILPLSHDEVVHGKRSMLSKMPGDRWQKFANLRLLYTYMFAHPGKKLLFMGSEFGQDWEWDHAAELRWNLLLEDDHARLKYFMSSLNALYRREPALWELDFDHRGFEWIDFYDQDQSVVAFVRKAADPADFLFFVFNFTPVPRHNYRLGAIEADFYEEVFNSDSEYFGGANLGNIGGVKPQPGPFGTWPRSITLTLPPLGALVLKPTLEPPV